MLRTLKLLSFALLLNAGMLQGMNNAQVETKQKATATAELHRLINELPSGQENSPEILKKVQALLDQGADPNPQVPSERSLLLTLLWKSPIKSNELLSLLIKAKANPFIKTNPRATSAYEWVEHMLNKGVKNGSYGYTSEEKESAIIVLRKIKQIFDSYSPAPAAPPAPRPDFMQSSDSADQKTEVSMTAGATPQTPETSTSASAASSSPAARKE